MTELANVTDRAVSARNRGGILALLLVLILGGAVVLLSAAAFPAAAGPLPFGAEAPQGGISLPLSPTWSVPRPTAVIRATRCVRPPAPARVTASCTYHVPESPTAFAAALRPFYNPQAPPVLTL